MSLDLLMSSDYIIFSIPDLFVGCKNIESGCFGSRNLWWEDFVFILETNLLPTEIKNSLNLFSIAKGSLIIPPFFCLDADYMIFIFILVYYLIYLLSHFSYVLTPFIEIFTWKASHLNFHEKHHISCLDHLFSEYCLSDSVFLCLLLNFLYQSLDSLFYKVVLFFKVIAEFLNYEKIWKMVTDFFKEVSASAVQIIKFNKKIINERCLLILSYYCWS